MKKYNLALIKKAIREAYLDYYGDQISDLCVERIINFLKEISK